MGSIPFVVLNKRTYLSIKVSYDIEVDLVGNRLPTEQELARIASSLWSKKYGRTFICFYLPGMVIDAGAFATAHSVHGEPQPTKINLCFLVGTEYESLIPPTNRK